MNAARPVWRGTPVDGTYLLYVDESGVPDRHPSQTTHFALAGLAIPAVLWADYHDQIESLKATYGIAGEEIHVAWLLPRYAEQSRVPNFAALSRSRRAPAVAAERARTLRAIEMDGRKSADLRTFYRKTAAYVHLSWEERQALALALVSLVSGWPQVTLFGDVINKQLLTRAADEEAFEQVVSRFQTFLARQSGVGVVAYDLNESQVARMTAGMADFQRKGGLWRKMDRIIGHPFFVGSHTSSLIQVADVVAYAIRRYVEHGEGALFDPLFPAFDRIGERLVGLRHYRGGTKCGCNICAQPR